LRISPGTTLTNQMRVLGEDVKEKELVKKLLRSVPDYLEHVAVSIETLLDLDNISIEEAIGQLRAVESRRKPTSSTAKNSSGQLLLTEEEWLAKFKLSDGNGKPGSSSGHGRDRGHGRGRGRGTSSPGKEKEKKSVENDKCLNCGKHGHWARDCCSKKKEESQLTQGEEEEQTLLMLQAVAVDLRDTAPTHGPVHVFAQLGAVEKGEHRRWVLDTGATNHMSGTRSAFVELDTGVIGTVRFGEAR
jgi:hypothetical protein